MPSKQRKIAMMGYRSVGKSSLIIQFVEGQFVDSYDPTIENTFTKFIRLNSTEYEVKLVDTAGQDEYSIFPLQYSMDFHGYVLVYSITSSKSFQIVQIIYDKLLDMVGKIQEHHPLHEKLTLGAAKLCGSHLPDEAPPDALELIIAITDEPNHRSVLSLLAASGICSHNCVKRLLKGAFKMKPSGPSVPIVLVGNKTDLHLERKISTEEGKRLAEKWKAAFVETSAKRNESVTDMFHAILSEIERSDGHIPDKNGCVVS